MLRLLADENFPGAAVKLLRERGYDVLWVSTEAPSITDDQVLERSKSENRIFLTFDKDCGERVFSDDESQRIAKDQTHKVMFKGTALGDAWSANVVPLRKRKWWSCSRR